MSRHSSRAVRLVFSFLCLLALLGPLPGRDRAAAQSAPAAVRLANADVRSVAASGSLVAQVRALVDRQIEPAWIGYVQPLVDGSMVSCCWGSDGQDGRGGCCGGCPLEGRTATGASGDAPPSATSAGASSAAARPAAPAPIKLEGATDFVVLLRVEQRRIERVRVLSAECDLDAGGRTVHLLTGVRGADSVALMESIVADWPATGRKGVPDAAIAAIAMLRDPAADAAFGRLLAPAQPEAVRRKAVFWAAKARGRAGFELTRRLLRDDPSREVRKQAVFALTQSREAEAMPTLFDTARTHPDTEVRGQALFWIAQKAGKQASATITRAIEEDPDTKVKERAVFALSQLPRDESVPLLIDVARRTANPAVRKRAMFWLGQSKDPRAIEFFASILK